MQSPLLEVGFPIPRWKTLAAVALATCWPSFPFSMDLDASALSHDASVVEAYRSDPLVHSAMSARTYDSILRTRDEATKRAPALRVPVLLLCAGDDRIISVAAAERWFERLTCRKQQRLFPGCYHELHHETVRHEVLDLIDAWAA